MKIEDTLNIGSKFIILTDHLHTMEKREKN